MKRLRAPVMIAAIIVLPIAGFFLLRIRRDVSRCRSLESRHARQREAMREELQRIRHELETTRPSSLSEVQKLFGGRPPKDCADRGGKSEPAFVARWDIPVRGQTVRMDVKVKECANDARVIGLYMGELNIDGLSLDGCPDESERR